MFVRPMAACLRVHANTMFSELKKSLEQQITLTDDEFERVKRYFVPKKLRRKQFLLEHL